MQDRILTGAIHARAGTHGKRCSRIAGTVAVSVSGCRADVRRAEVRGPLRAVRKPVRRPALVCPRKRPTSLLRQSLPGRVDIGTSGRREASGLEGTPGIQGWKLEGTGRTYQRAGRLPLQELRGYRSVAGPAAGRPPHDARPSVRVDGCGQPAGQSGLGLRVVPQTPRGKAQKRASSLPRGETSRSATGPRLTRIVRRTVKPRSSPRTGVHRPCRRGPDSRPGQRRTASRGVRTGPPPPSRRTAGCRGVRSGGERRFWSS